MNDYGIVNYGTDRFEVLADGRRIAVFDHENDAKIFVSMKKARVGELAKERNRYRGQVKILTEALQPFARVWESPEPFYPLDLDYERASEVLAQIREASNG